MTGASKILTVSYGTFSCTLEGFDEPFNTMKAIAEYFRDLAADDRYFGAEPPTPDAAMLHKIAEREIQRRVEAKVSDHGVLLRADDTPAPRVTMPSVASVAEAAPAVESAAARLSRLRAAQTQVLPPAPLLGDISNRFSDVEAYAEDQDAEPVIAAPAPKAALPEPAPEPITLTAPAAYALPEIEDYAEEPEAAPAAPMPAQTEPAADPVSPPPAVLETILTEPAPPVLAAPAPEVTPDAQDDLASEGILSSLRETLAGLSPQDDQLAADISEAADTPPQIADEPAEELLAEVPFHTHAKSDVFDFVDLKDVYDQEETAELEALDGEDFADLPQVDPVKSVAQVEPTATAPTEAEVDLSNDAPIVAEKIQRARARVIKISRTDKKPVEPTLSPDAEADLQNTLAALEAELAPAPAAQDRSVEAMLDAVLDAPSPVPAHSSAPGADEAEKATDTRIAAADDAAVDRLLAQTNTQLEVPEVKRRRSAIAHLKAAVLATVADRKSDPAAQSRGAEVKMDPYRKDLNQAVRPSGSADRPAPLVLVSAQRIDRTRDSAADPNRPVPQIVPAFALPVQPERAQPATVLPVRPRRVTATGAAQGAAQRPSDEPEDDQIASPVNNIFSGTAKQNFSEFAESLGADSLAELIEAAAAYCTLVLDQPSFTRPMLFQQIAAVPSVAGLHPEDSLRSFGKLLRDGRIQKTYRGQFALSHTSPILTEAKRIAS
jgi:hypothetical protein